MEGLRNQVFRKLKTFKSFPDAAQTIILEKGGWKLFNEWMRNAIASKDVQLILEILQVLETMPTTFSELTGAGGQLTITVEDLLKNTVSGKSNDFGREESEKLKVKCAEVFARWLRLKKKSRLEKVPPLQVGETLKQEIKTGEVIVETAPIEREFGLLAIKGRTSVVELTPLPTPPTTPSDDGESSSENLNDTVLLSDVMPSNKTASSSLATMHSKTDVTTENQNPEEFELPQEMSKITHPNNEDTGGVIPNLDMNPILHESQETASLILTSTPTKDLPSILPPLEKVFKKCDLMDNLSPVKTTAAFEMEPPTKMAHRWEDDDGVRSAYLYEASEDLERLGTAKEKRISIIPSDRADDLKQEAIPWKLVKLALPPTKPSMAAYIRYPLEDRDLPKPIPTEDITNSKIKWVNTWIYDHSQKGWPEPSNK